MEGLEVAAWPILYPWSRYGDTDVRARLAQGGSGTAKQHYSGKQSFIRKLLSRNRAYDQEPSLAFYLHDVLFARMLLSRFTVAYRGGSCATHVTHGTGLAVAVHHRYGSLVTHAVRGCAIDS